MKFRPTRAELSIERAKKMPALPRTTLLAVWVFVDKDGTYGSGGTLVHPLTEEERTVLEEICRKTMELLVEGT